MNNKWVSVFFLVSVYWPLVSIAEVNTHVGGVTELQGGYVFSGAGGESGRTPIAASVEIEIVQRLGSSVEARFVFVHEEDISPFAIDEGTITFHRFFDSQVQATVGKMVLPFGKFDSALISDPLTLAMAETKRNAIRLNINFNDFTPSLFAYTGNDGVSARPPAASLFGLGIEFTRAGIRAGLHYLHDIAQVDGVQNSSVVLSAPRRSASGLAGFVSARIGKFDLFAEYITALSYFHPDQTDASEKFRPSTYQLELVYRPGNYALAGGFQGSRGAQSLGLPSTRLLVGGKVFMRDRMSLAMELAREEDYSSESTGSSRLNFSTQWAVEF